MFLGKVSAFALCLLLAPQAVSSATSGPAALWGPEISRFLDEGLNSQLRRDRIPGAVVSVVHRGGLVHLGGYGYADLARGAPVSAEISVFRTGSVSKLVTWTAVMQLVEQGRLDLHADVNRHLTSFALPATFAQPITLAHLATHTAGLEDRAFGFYGRSAADLMPLGDFLASRMPARIFPPGEVSAYSNYGAALAGHLIERVSGLPFEDYVEREVLQPLGMARSSFRQPLPAALAERLVTGYRASLTPGEFELDLATPAGALSTTAADMAGFMMAHLQGGRLEGTRVLAEPTAAAMQTTRFRNHPAVSGMTYGFQEQRIGRERVLTQPGDMLHYTAALFLIPEHDLGLFVAYNRGRAAHAPMELLRALLARLFPDPPWTMTAPVPRHDLDVGPVAGSYRSTRRNETGLEKLQELFAPVRVRAAGPASLLVTGLVVVPESLWLQTEPGVFRDPSGSEVIAFRLDESGRASHLFEGNFPAAGYTRLPWHGAPEVHLRLLAIGTLVFFLTPIVWSLTRRRRPAIGHPLARRARWVAGALCLVNLVFVAGIVTVVARGRELLFGITPLARAVLLLPLLSAALTALTLVLAVVAWRNGWWTRLDRLHFSLVGLVGLGFVWSLGFWGLIGFRV